MISLWTIFYSTFYLFTLFIRIVKYCVISTRYIYACIFFYFPENLEYIFSCTEFSLYWKLWMKDTNVVILTISSLLTLCFKPSRYFLWELLHCCRFRIWLTLIRTQDISLQDVQLFKPFYVVNILLCAFFFMNKHLEKILYSVI